MTDETPDTATPAEPAEFPPLPAAAVTPQNTTRGGGPPSGKLSFPRAPRRAGDGGNDFFSDPFKSPED